MLNDRNAMPKDGHPIALFDPPLLGAPGVPSAASPHEQVDPIRLDAGALAPQRYRSGFAKEGDVTAVGCQARNPRFDAAHPKGHS